MEQRPRPAAALYVVATPIGNLGDITLRAVETLRHVEWVLAEDTRRTRSLLSHLGISKPVTRVDAHSSPATLQGIVAKIASGQPAALVTDAGVPAVSDPGALLVAAATQGGVTVVPVPGASAVTAAVSVSGFSGGTFFFFGFLPRKGKERKDALDRLCAMTDSVVLLESPHRCQATLADLAERTPERQILVARELTKLNEELARGTAAELAVRSDWRGEITLVLGPKDALASAPLDELGLSGAIAERLLQGQTARVISAELAVRFSLPRRDVYERVLLLRSKHLEGEPSDDE